MPVNQNEGIEAVKDIVGQLNADYGENAATVQSIDNSILVLTSSPNVASTVYRECPDIQDSLTIEVNGRPYTGHR